jgi:hypothetical protein
MSLLLLLNTPAPSGGGSQTKEILLARFMYDLVFRGELREEDQSFLGANDKQTVKRAKIIRIMEAV